MAPRRDVLPPEDELIAVLERHSWVITDAAKALNVSRQAIYYAFERYGIQRQETPPEVRSKIARRGYK